MKSLFFIFTILQAGLSINLHHTHKIPSQLIPFRKNNFHQKHNIDKENFIEYKDLFVHGVDVKSHKLGQAVVRYVSSYLPKVDSIGHNILHANNEFISDVLNNHMLSPQLQKSIILSSIKLAQMGDDMGSHMLQWYYNIVDYSL